MAMITSLPPQPPAVVAPATMRQEILLGVANPEWLHLGYQYRQDFWGVRALVGTLATAQSYTVGGRYFPWAWQDDWKKGLNLEGALALHQLANKTQGITPTDLWPVSHLSVGYDCNVGPFTFGMSLGTNPISFASGSRPLVSTNAAALPRLQLQVGYAY